MRDLFLMQCESIPEYEGYFFVNQSIFKENIAQANKFVIAYFFM